MEFVEIATDVEESIAELQFAVAQFAVAPASEQCLYEEEPRLRGAAEDVSLALRSCRASLHMFLCFHDTEGNPIRTGTLTLYEQTRKRLVAALEDILRSKLLKPNIKILMKVGSTLRIARVPSVWAGGDPKIDWAIRKGDFSLSN